MQKVNFAATVAGNAKLLEIVKRGGWILNGVGAILTVIDINKNGLSARNGTDLAMAVISLAPGGWVISGIYYLGKETGLFDALVNATTEVMTRCDCDPSMGLQ